MNSRERVEAALAFEPVDRVPVFDIIQNNEVVKRCTGGEPTVENGLDLLCECISQNLDATRGVAGPAAPRSWKDAEGFGYEGEWWTAWITERPFITVAETQAFVKKAIQYLDSLGPDTVYTFHGPTNTTTGGKAFDSKTQFLAMRDMLGGPVLFHLESPVGLDTAFHRLGIELFSYAYAEDPILISDWLEALNIHEVNRVRSLQNAYEMSPVALVYADLADKNSTIFSPSFLRKELIPRLERLVSAWHAHGVKVIYHSDGDVWGVLDDLVATGIDGINPLEPLSKMDAVKVRKHYPHLVLVGGIDASELLPYGNPDQVLLEVNRILDATEGRGILLGSSTEIHPACAVDNVFSMWAAARDWRPRR